MRTSLARNFASKGISLSLYNRFVPGDEEAVATVASQALVAGMAVPVLSEAINYDHAFQLLTPP